MTRPTHSAEEVSYKYNQLLFSNSLIARIQALKRSRVSIRVKYWNISRLFECGFWRKFAGTIHTEANRWTIINGAFSTRPELWSRAKAKPCSRLWTWICSFSGRISRSRVERRNWSWWRRISIHNGISITLNRPWDLACLLLSLCYFKADHDDQIGLSVVAISLLILHPSEWEYYALFYLMIFRTNSNTEAEGIPFEIVDTLIPNTNGNNILNYANDKLVGLVLETKFDREQATEGQSSIGSLEGSFPQEVRRVLKIWSCISDNREMERRKLC